MKLYHIKQIGRYKRKCVQRVKARNEIRKQIIGKCEADHH